MPLQLESTRNIVYVGGSNHEDSTPRVEDDDGLLVVGLCYVVAGAVFLLTEFGRKWLAMTLFVNESCFFIEMYM